jgi:alpha-1,3-rhamnosyl/mannosyltransferase
MRIGIDIGKLAIRPDGVGRYCAGLLRGLAEVERALPQARGNRYVLFSLQGEPAADGLPAWLARLGDRFELSARAQPKRGEVDLFHCTAHDVPDDHDGALLFSLYDVTFLTLPQAHTLGNRLRCTAGLARALARGGRLAAISEHTRRDAVRLLGIEPATVAVVPPGLDHRFDPPPAAVEARATAARLGLSGDYILHVGVEEPRKNVGALVEAYRRLPAGLRERYTLALAGHGGWGDSPAAADAASDAPGEVRRLGPVSEEDLPPLYAGAALFVFPSLYEGFGLPPLEAMACGAPVLVSSVASLPEVVGEAAELCDPTPAAIAVAIERVLGDPSHRAELRRRGLLRAREFNWVESARLLRVVYEQTVEGV